MRSRADFLTRVAGTWAAYAAGCACLLLETHRIPMEGLEFTVDSEVPAGKDHEVLKV